MKGAITLYMFGSSDNSQVLNNTLNNELRRISNRLTRIAIILEAFLTASFPDKSIINAIYDMRDKIEEAEKLNS